LRCLYLEAQGYQVTVTELVGWEHSMKNELIIARYTGQKAQCGRALAALLREFGLSNPWARGSAWEQRSLRTKWGRVSIGLVSSALTARPWPDSPTDAAPASPPRHSAWQQPPGCLHGCEDFEKLWRCWQSIGQKPGACLRGHAQPFSSLVTPATERVAQMMQSVGRAYARYFNKRH
jgi:hypothetical protein